jgi:hypothetical protein
VNEERVKTLLGKPVFTFEGENYFLKVRNYQGVAPSEKKDCRLSSSTELREISIRNEKLLYYVINILLLDQHLINRHLSKLKKN